MLVDLGTSLRCSLSGLCERKSVLTAHAAAQDLEHGVAGRSIERGRVSLMRRWECGGAALGILLLKRTREKPKACGLGP